MFNSSSDLTPAPPPKTLGKDPSTLSTDEHGRPVPYLAGRVRLGLTWISEPWGVRSVPIRKKVGKKTQTTGYNYYASFAGVLCLGPVQTLHAILVDDEVAWNGPLQAGTSDCAEITVEGRGALTLYWGTATQTADADLAASGVTHPAYRGQCYAVTGRPLTQAIEYDWITDPAVAWKVAMAYGKSRSLPWLDGRLRVRRGVGADLRSGDTVSLTYAHSGIDAVRFRVLAVEVPGPDSAEVLLTVREDTAHLAVDDYPAPAGEALAAVQYSPLPCHDVLVFEPPFAWTADTTPRLLILPARGERLSSGFTLWWERATDSFTTAGTGQVFGRRGTLNAALNATGCLYHEGGLDVTFTSPDDDLEDMPFDEGVGTKRFLIFIGDEILLGWEPTLVSAGRYTVNLLRAQYGTTRGQHGIGAECWCVQLAEVEGDHFDGDIGLQHGHRGRVAKGVERDLTLLQSREAVRGAVNQPSQLVGCSGTAEPLPESIGQQGSVVRPAIGLEPATQFVPGHGPQGEAPLFAFMESFSITARIAWSRSPIAWSNLSGRTWAKCAPGTRSTGGPG
jgi:hypothetical protein